MPIHTPSPLPNLVGPTKRTVPRLWKFSSVVSTSHRAPTEISTLGAGAGADWDWASASANRPILFRCLNARTVSAQRPGINHVKQGRVRNLTLTLSIRIIRQFKLINLRDVSKLTSERSRRIRIDDLRPTPINNELL